MSAAAPAKKAFSSFYRVAGLSYLDALNVASISLRKVMKEPARTEAQSRANYKFREFNYAGGHESSPLEVYSSPAMMKAK